MSSALLPPAFWFRTAFRSPRIDGLPRGGATGPLLGLPASCALPDADGLKGEWSWAEVRTAWNPRGLALAVAVRDKPAAIPVGEPNPDFADGLDIWIDTRDTRDIHRASRHCHHFSVRLSRAKRGAEPTATVRQHKIARALGDPPTADPALMSTRVATAGPDWTLEWFIPAACLNGFDPETNRRLGFYLSVIDPLRGTKYLGVGREFPIGEDPSLWAVLELRDESPD